MSLPLVSVIIPVYNGERFVAEGLESVFAQDYRLIEVIVVDDGSTDRTAETVRAFDQVQYVYQTNLGVASARNKGISLANGEFIALLDHDDLWTPDKLRRQVNFLLEHPEVDYVLVKQRMFIQPGMEQPDWVRSELLENSHTAFVPSSMLCRKSVFAKVGLFNPAYKISDDADWFFRANSASIVYRVLPDVLLRKRVHDKNLTQSVSVTQTELLKAVRESLRSLRPRS
jgi:glycosyltransferase involved in cell wall biosynthesis